MDKIVGHIYKSNFMHHHIYIVHNRHLPNAYFIFSIIFVHQKSNSQISKCYFAETFFFVNDRTLINILLLQFFKYITLF